jgi:1-acyl-sn-glycerol-3-phosphate acyltransferase
LPNKLLYTFGRIFVRAYARMMLRLDIHWHDALPSGPKLFVANHPIATDPFLIHLVSPQPMSVMITVNAFTVPMFGYFLRRLKQIPVGEEGGGASLGEARCAIERGHSVGRSSPKGSSLHREVVFTPRAAARPGWRWRRACR